MSTPAKPFKSIISVLFLFILLFACCKKSKTDAPSSSSVGARFLYGYFIAAIDSFHNVYDTLHNTSYNIDYAFYDDSVKKNIVSPGQIFINGLELQTSISSRFDTGLHCTINGSDYVPAMAYTAQNSFPVYRGKVPDSFSLSNGLTIDFSNDLTNNSDSAVVFCNIGNAQLRVVAPCTGTITIDSASWASLNPGHEHNFYPRTLHLTIEIRKYDYQVVSNKEYVFVRAREYYADVSTQ